MEKAAAIYLIAFGLATLAGGFQGYVKAKSTISLIAGLVNGALLAAAGFTVLQTGSRNALLLGLLVSGALGGLFLQRWLRTRKPMPAIPMIGLSLIAVILCALAL